MLFRRKLRFFFKFRFFRRGEMLTRASACVGGAMVLAIVAIVG